MRTTEAKSAPKVSLPVSDEQMEYDLTKVKDRILYLADLIEGKASHPKLKDITFDMKEWYPKYSPCGTAACIGGHIDIIAGVHQDEEETARWIGLSWGAAQPLFYPRNPNDYAATPNKAARVLRHLAETDEVDWSVAYHPTPKDQKGDEVQIDPEDAAASTRKDHSVYS